MPWICASCGAQHDENDPPCHQCAGEQFAKLDESRSSIQRVDGVQHIEWHCKNCGESHLKNNPPCKRCGGMDFQAVHIDEPAPAADGGVAAFDRTGTRDATISESRSEPRQVTLRSVGYVLWVVWMCLSTVGGIMTGLGPAVLFFAATLLSVRTTRYKIYDVLNIELSRAALYTFGAILYLSGNFWIAFS